MIANRRGSQTVPGDNPAYACAVVPTQRAPKQRDQTATGLDSNRRVGQDWMQDLPGSRRLAPNAGGLFSRKRATPGRASGARQSDAGGPAGSAALREPVGPGIGESE